MAAVEIEMALVLRLLSVVLYTGVFFFYCFVVTPIVNRMPPTHRAAITFTVVKKTIAFSTAIVIIMVSSGLLYSEWAGILNFTGPQRPAVLIGLDVMTNGLVLLTTFSAIALMVRRTSAPSQSAITSPVDEAKWFTYDNTASVLSFLSKTNRLFLANLVLGVLSIVLGALIQQAR